VNFWIPHPSAVGVPRRPGRFPREPLRGKARPARTSRARLPARPRRCRL